MAERMSIDAVAGSLDNLQQVVERMPVDHVVSSVDEAVKLANDWRATGRRTWFRGQVDASWPLVSSLARKGNDATALQEAQERIRSFSSWLRNVPELRYLLEEEHVHECFAVLQHYGIPTHYVDFTTEPQIAGFFAANDQKAVPPVRGCIIAIDPDEFVNDVRTIWEIQGLSAKSWPEKVIASVPNLWRMQAQSGCFIYLPRPGVEHTYSYDRIVFPHNGFPYPIAKESMFPTRRSVLEIRLDEFFTEELMHNNQRYFRELYERWEQNGVKVDRIFTEELELAKYLRAGTAAHDSWKAIDVRWIAFAGEQLTEAMADAPEVHISLPDSPDGPSIEAAVAREARQLITTLPECRRKAVRWRLISTEQEPGKHNARLERVWDGMRRLPYTDDQLIVALATTASRSMRPAPKSDRTALELATERWVPSSATVSTDQIRAAFRPDLANLLLDPSLAETPSLLLQVLRNPAYAFDFEKLVDLFATDIIPAQVVEGREDLVVFYSPALSVIGKA